MSTFGEALHMEWAMPVNALRMHVGNALLGFLLVCLLLAGPVPGFAVLIF